MKNVCFFLLSVIYMSITMTNIEADTLIETNKRNEFSYEILDVNITNNYITINGWGLLPARHHFIGSSTHSYDLVFKGNNHNLEYKGSINNTNLTKIMEYRGIPKCSQNSLNKKNCNYLFENVGFVFNVPLDDLKTNENYKLSLKLHSKPLKSTFITDLYYPKDTAIETIHNDRNIKLTAHYQTMNLEVFYHTLVARTKASPLSKAYETGKSCSHAYKNTAFFKQNAIFYNIRGIEKYNDLITYFKVNVKDAGCVNNRRRVDEGLIDQDTVYIPSTYVNYQGKPLSVQVKQILHKPIIKAENQTINQYSKYDPYNYAEAEDKQDGNITDKIVVTKNTVNTRIPGRYQTCYKVTNSFKLTSTKCIDVFVIKVKTYYRYINKRSKEVFYKNSVIWNTKDLQAKLNKVLSIIK